MIRRGRKEKRPVQDPSPDLAKTGGFDPHSAPEGNGQKTAGRKPRPAAGQASQRPENERLGQLLLKDRLVSDNQLAEALIQQEVSGKKLGALLVDLGVVDERTIVTVVAQQTGFPLADLSAITPDPAALELIPEGLAREAVLIPLRVSDKGLEVAVSDPTDEATLRKLSAAAGGKKLQLLVASPSDIRRTIDGSYRALSGIEAHIAEFQQVEAVRRPEVAQAAVIDEAPVIKVVNSVVIQGLRDRASDIHIEPQEGRVRVRYRIDGALHDVLALPETMGPAIISRIKILGGMNIVERQRPLDGQIEMNIDGRPLDVRVSTTPTIWGEKAVLRLLDKSKPVFRLEDLGMPPDTREVYEKLVRAPVGMMICAGPTGSGKTTTLYATLNEVNDTQRNVMTVEDPVEYVFPSINQIQIRESAGITFANGLKSILRQDPDIILVGEMRDVETARIAVQSALTGHLVLSSIHATDAVSALHRFLDMGIEPFLIASAITGIVGQRLVRRICMHCKAKYVPTAEETAFYQDLKGTKVKPPTFYLGKGCNFCSGTGYQERIGVYELLQVTNELKQLIVRHASHDKLMAQALKQGMRPLAQEAIRLVDEGWTTIPEVVRTIYSH